MAQSLTKVYLHIIFHIKTTSITIRNEDLEPLHAYIAGMVRNLNSWGLRAGGTADHVHLLCTMPKNITIPEFVQKIKVASHKHLEEIDPRHYKHFAWQSGYGVFSVSPSILDNVTHYIKNQQEHHSKRTFQEEYMRFMKEYKVQEANSEYLFTD